MWLRRTATVMGCALIAAGLSAGAGARRAAGRLSRTRWWSAPASTGPSGFDIAPDGRIFVLEREGTVKIVKNGQLLAQPFADLPSAATGDRGLIGIAFDPAVRCGQQLRLLLLHRTRPAEPPGAFRRARATSDRGPVRDLLDPDAVAVAARRRQHRLRPRRQAVPRRRRQRLPRRTPRISPTRTARYCASTPTARIPADNPFVGQPSKLGAIWAYGLRNPWRFQFDRGNRSALRRRRRRQLVGRAQPHRRRRQLRVAARRGQVHRELRRADRSDLHLPAQRDRAPRSPTVRSTAATMFPAAVPGADVLRRLRAGLHQDSPADRERRRDAASARSTPPPARVVDLKVAPDGSLYYVTYFPGELHRVIYSTASHPPIANAAASLVAGVQPLAVQFSSAGTQRPGRRRVDVPLGLRRRHRQHVGEPDQDVHGSRGALHGHSSPSPTGSTRPPRSPSSIQVGVAADAHDRRAGRWRPVPGR